MTQLVQQTGAKHVVVKLYQRVEGVTNIAHARSQIASAKSLGCSVGGYVWLYASVDIEQQINDALSLLEPTVLWLDIEKYTDGSMPNEQQIRQAIEYVDRLGKVAGVYSGQYIWQELGNPSFPGVPLWSANYNNMHDLTSVPSYGDMTLVGHQYTNTPCDRSVFMSGVC